jgi:P-type Mg2+ transporter
VAARSGASGPAVPAPAFWSVELPELFRTLDSTAAGLSTTAAAARLRRDGPNRIAPARRSRGLRLLISQFTSPIVLILVVATVLSAVLGDVTDGLIILAIIAASGLLGFWQERSAGIAVDLLLSQVRIEAEALRDGREVTVPTEDLVVGDIVLLNAGDVVPADCRVIESQQLLVDESSLTGESFPAEKRPGPAAPDAAPTARRNAVFLGSHVASGAGRVLVARVGAGTEFGALSADVAERDVTTGFERGMAAFGYLLVRAMVVLVTGIFVVNLALGRPVVDSILFSLALAVGLTPQLLPAIVALSLATGAKRMAAEKVIVRRLDAIEDFGTMTVLCTDKTGTLTGGVAGLVGAVDLVGAQSESVLALARLNAGLQQGFSNPMDEAILAGSAAVDPALSLDELPYDFERRRLSVLALGAGGAVLVTKGALAEILSVCDSAEVDGARVPIGQLRAQVDSLCAALSAQGSRILGLATRDMPGCRAVELSDEADMVLRGLLVFRDPAKPGADVAIAGLARLGVSVRLVTGDNRLAAGRIALAVGLDQTAMLTGRDLDQLDPTRLAEEVRRTNVFAEVDPLQKVRIVEAFRATGQTVGFLGDGINDAGALHASDVGISVDSAADVAKQAASIVLLDKDLGVVADGVRLGRRTFANTLKYVRVTTSANFGNMLSMAVAAAFLPFLPMLPRQILLLNLLSDIPATTIAEDEVDPEQIQAPHAWDIRAIRTFMIVFGMVSSLFDVATFLALRLVFHADADLFRSGWFVQSTATELVVLLVLRTQRPFWRSRPGRALLVASALVAVITVWLPFSPFAPAMGLVAIPAAVLGVLVLLTVLYAAANEIVKQRVGITGSRTGPGPGVGRTALTSGSP